MGECPADRQAIREKRTLIAERDELRANAERILNLPENRSTRDQSQFLNELIRQRKAFRGRACWKIWKSNASARAPGVDQPATG
jgi:hypothetical protein